VHRVVKLAVAFGCVAGIVVGAAALAADPEPTYGLGSEFEGLALTESEKDMAQYGQCAEGTDESTCQAPLTVLTLGDAPCPATAGSVVSLPGGARAAIAAGGGTVVILTGDDVVLVDALDTDLALRAARQVRQDGRALRPVSASNRCRV
jgi:hypothetical protein